MGQATPFEHDIFIGYAHIDDKPLLEGGSGWVTSFHQTLDTMVQQISGEEMNIWRDPKLQGNDYFSDTLVDALPKTAVLISIVSPRYLKSDWCLKELNEFRGRADADGTARFEDKNLIFKVVKTAIPREEQPTPLDELLGYEFFDLNPDTGRPNEFRVEFGDEAKLRYFDKLGDIAYEITDLLKEIRSTESISGGVVRGEPVYLAESTSDLSEERDRVKAELRQLGHEVLPDTPFPIDAEKLASAVEADLARCCLSIHLMGSKAGFVPEGELRSVVRIQNELAASHSRERGLARLVWIPPGLVPADDRQAKLIEMIEADASAQEGADVLRTSLEDLKSIIRDRLRRPETAKETEPVDQNPDWVQAYLVCDQFDFERAQTLADHLYDSGFEVVFPVFEGDETEVREDHIDKLATSNVVLLYQGEARDLWLSSKLRDLRKLRTNRFIAVLGTSGSGKSSLVLAGMLPDLYGGFMAEAGSRWRVAILRPGDAPIRTLAESLSAPGVLWPVSCRFAPMNTWARGSHSRRPIA